MGNDHVDCREDRLHAANAERMDEEGGGRCNTGVILPFNALAETINGLYKAEVIHRRGPWRSFESVEFATLERVDWFNNRRLLQRIGTIPPAEAEERYYAVLDMPLCANDNETNTRREFSLEG